MPDQTEATDTGGFGDDGGGLDERRDQLWVTDITEHPTFEGKVYCAVVLDTFSRRVVGWSIDASPTAALTTNALAMAIGNRSPSPGGTIIHSDHGVEGGFTLRARASGCCPRWAPSETAWTTR
ncbi:DDE-type integrase/transposase/recombinase (plasmid) [Streptomyces sp. Qhu-G9]|uniref:DDE-type integrase/transposase/recombinase n=1 Tax=Streptomyces sp. Qhu-G9 TaxID=3452799 RepID=UPI0022ABF4DB|nr:DDE-type integrase/transposase/recombinase [Streptomyces aurantiacus]WAU78465.1 DDE-type integrase/transposase/recombinase [Streptomyces aurantiacus]